MNNRPQVILIGNGINRAFSGGSWYDALDRIKTRDDIDVHKLKAPMPLIAALVTGNKLSGVLAEHRQEFFGSDMCPEQTAFTNRLLAHGFDEILTTNYSYELEADTEGHIPDEGMLEDSHTFNRCDGCKGLQKKYFLHTFNMETRHGQDNRVWHIHGEARIPDSIILGHYYYANLLSRMQQVVAKDYCQLCNDGSTGCPSWVDSFMFGDVYILGFGFDFSEFDMWWLVNRKQREKAHNSKSNGKPLNGLQGRVYWFEPAPHLRRGEIDEKRELLRSMNVECRHMDYTTWPDGFISKKDGNGREYFSDYREFYNDALNEIMKLSKENGRKQPDEA